MDTITGFTIEKRELTPEEASRPATAERFMQFNRDAGEEYCDQTQADFSDRVIGIFGGFLLAKHPEFAKEIIAILNGQYHSLNDFLNLYEEKFDDREGEKFYTDLAEFVNFCPSVLHRVNQVLIQVHEYYNPDG